MKNKYLKRLVPKALHYLLLAVILVALIIPALPLTSLFADSIDLYAVLVTGNNNWSAASTWSTTADGLTPGHVAPTTNNNVYPSAICQPGSTLTIDVDANCKGIDFSTAANPITIASPSRALNIYGATNFTGVTISSAYSIKWYGTGTVTFGGATISNNYYNFGVYGGTTTFTDAANFGNTNNFRVQAGTLDTNGQTVTCNTFTDNSSDSAKTLTLGNSTINCKSFSFPSAGLTVTANTATINITGTGSLSGGNYDYNGASFNLNGTAHTVSGNFTCATLTRNGTATKTDTVTFTSGNTVTCTTCAMKGNSSTNRLLVKSSTIGSPATITATNWTGSQNIDIMDIAVTNAVDLSAITGLSGDCGGNTDITFTSSTPQNFTNPDGGTWSTAANWTSRVPLPQDDITITTAFNSGKTITIDMWRIGRNIDYSGMSWTGTATTVTKSNDYYIYGSLELNSDFIYTGGYVAYFYARGACNLTSNSQTVYAIGMQVPTCILTLQDDLLCGYYVQSSGTLIDNGKTIILNSTLAMTKWNITGGTITATGTLALTSTSANAQTFAGNGAAYNNVYISGTGNYVLTLTGNNSFNEFKIDSPSYAKTVKFTDGSTTIVSNLTRDPGGSSVITLTGTGAAGWNLTKSDTTPVSLDYLSVDYCNATQANVWYAGTHSTDGAHNTNWSFTDPILTVTTNAATNITMDKDGVTGVQLNGTIGTLDGTPSYTAYFEYGLTAAYGSTTSVETMAQTGAIHALLPSSSDVFTIAVVPDPQHEVSTFTPLWNQKMEWIASNYLSNNIKAVICTGDQVDVANTTDFTASKAGWDIIDAVGLPYLTTLGNHDYNTIATRDTTTYNNYFGLVEYGGKTWYGGNYGVANDSFYVTFTVGNYKYIIFSLEYLPRNEVLTWAQGIINANTDANIIINTHSYLNYDGTLSTDVVFGNGGQLLWNNFIKINPNIILVTSGHSEPSPYVNMLNTNNNTGYPVPQIRFDYQDDIMGGNGYIGLLTINPKTNKISSTAYSTHTGLYDATAIYNMNYHSVSPITNTNLTPGATYHYRAVATNSNGIAYGADQTFTFTMPTIATGTSNVSGNNTVINGSISNMGVATDTYSFFEYGTTPALGTSTALQTVAAIGAITSTIPSPGSSNILYYRIGTTNGATTTYGSTQSLSIPSGVGGMLLRTLLRVVLAGAIMLGVMIVGRNGADVQLLMAALVGLLAFVIIDLMLISLI